MIKLNLNENFISRSWEDKSCYSELETTDGRKITVIDKGVRNLDEGPDFRDSKIYIGNQLFSGDVEIHKSFADWNIHKHRNKGKYNVVILQVVMWDNDSVTKELPKAKKSREIPTVILSKFLTKSIHLIWREIINSPSPHFKIPCHPDNINISPDDKTEYLESMGRKRLNYRLDRISGKLSDFEFKGYNPKNSRIWERLLIEFVFEALGFSKNKKPFIKLAGILNIEKILDLKLSHLQMDSVIFGSAGMLNELRYKDEYILTLKKYWNDYKSVLKIESLDKADWNYFRLRPHNFPSVRLGYGSAFLFSIVYNQLFKYLITTFESLQNPVKFIKDFFLNIEPSEYWKRHYNFGKPSKNFSLNIGKDRVEDIIVNVIFPFILLYSKYFNKSGLTEIIYKEYNSLKGYSKNDITRAMEKQLQIKLKNTIQSQGAIHLHNFYCVKGKCNECNIGNKLFIKDESLNYLKIILY